MRSGVKRPEEGQLLTVLEISTRSVLKTLSPMNAPTKEEEKERIDLFDLTKPWVKVQVELWELRGYGYVDAS